MRAYIYRQDPNYCDECEKLHVHPQHSEILPLNTTEIKQAP